jgi:hypothetical protein
MRKRIIEQLFNTPEKYWVVIGGYHFHKSFWGTLLIGIGLFLQSLWLAGIGCILIFLSVAGHIYTNNKPYFKLWEKYEK